MTQEIKEQTKTEIETEKVQVEAKELSLRLYNLNVDRKIIKSRLKDLSIINNTIKVLLPDKTTE